MTDIKFSRLVRPNSTGCVLDICDGSGWIDMGNGISVNCKCREIYREIGDTVSEMIIKKTESDFRDAFMRGADFMNQIAKPTKGSEL